MLKIVGEILPISLSRTIRKDSTHIPKSGFYAETFGIFAFSGMLCGNFQSNHSYTASVVSEGIAESLSANV